MYVKTLFALFVIKEDIIGLIEVKFKNAVYLYRANIYAIDWLVE